MRRLTDIFCVDLRSLALFRIALASVVLLDLGSRLLAFRVWYLGEGVLFHAALFPDWVVLLALGAGFLGALALLVGFHARLSALITWAALMVLNNQNRAILIGADSLLALLLLWSIFLPIGARFSLKAKGGAGKVCSIGSAALMLQLAMLYLFTALLKLKAGTAWFPEGVAAHDVLLLSQPLTFVGAALLPFDGALRLITYAVILIELLAPLILIPRLRMWMVACLLIVQIGIGATMQVGLFPLVASVGLLPFIPGAFWDRLLPPSRSVRPKPIGPLSQAICLVMLVLAIGYNLQSIGLIRMPADRIAYSFELRQRWEMFTNPKIIGDDIPTGYYELYSVRGSARERIDYAGEPLRGSAMAWVSDQRWRRLLAAAAKTPLRGPYGDFLCAEAGMPDRIDAYFHHFSAPGEAGNVALAWRHQCLTT